MATRTSFKDVLRFSLMCREEGLTSYLVEDTIKCSDQMAQRLIRLALDLDMIEPVLEQAKRNQPTVYKPKFDPAPGVPWGKRPAPLPKVASECPAGRCIAVESCKALGRCVGQRLW